MNIISIEYHIILKILFVNPPNPSLVKRIEHCILHRKRWIFDNTQVLHQIGKWKRNLAWIKPYYAMKANPSPELIKTIVNSGMQIGLDVASINEAKTGLKYVEEREIIYTNPHTIPYDEREYFSLGIQTKVVDSLGELKKIAESNFYNYKPKILIRLKSNIYSAHCHFDSKFGCSREVAFQILEYATRNNIQICGISFHIGSGGDFDRNLAYKTAFEYARPVLDAIENPIVDVGGGLLYDTDLTAVLGWTKDLPYRFIAEPGRYFAEPAYHLLVQVIAVTERGIFIDNGVYHELNVYHRDHWSFPKLEYLYDNTDQSTKKIDDYRVLDIFGPTCDSYDMIPAVSFPDMRIEPGDWIFLPNMGAYTSAAAVNFNGISSAFFCEEDTKRFFI